VPTLAAPAAAASAQAPQGLPSSSWEAERAAYEGRIAALQEVRKPYNGGIATKCLNCLPSISTLFAVFVVFINLLSSYSFLLARWFAAHGRLILPRRRAVEHSRLLTKKLLPFVMKS
jgi:hypothetical protein